MTAGKIPPGSDEFSWRRMGGTVGTIGAGLVGASTMQNNYQKNHHNRLLREQQRGEALKKGNITAMQYVSYSSKDGQNPREIKANLEACGGIHEGHNYSNFNSFEVEKVRVPSSNPLKWATNIKDEFCRLKLYPSPTGAPTDTPTDGPTGPSTGINVSYRGLRGGYNPSTEQRTVSNFINEIDDGTEMVPEKSRYSPNMSYFSPNPSYEVSHQLAVDPRPVKESFTVPITPIINPAVFYVVGVSLALALSLLFEYVKGYVKRKLTGSKESDSTLEETLSAEGVTRVEGQEKGLETVEERAKQGTAEVFLETLISFRRRAITKKDAVYILGTYYGLSEEKALELLG
jgi:hypothetical protein